MTNLQMMFAATILRDPLAGSAYLLLSVVSIVFGDRGMG